MQQGTLTYESLRNALELNPNPTSIDLSRIISLLTIIRDDTEIYGGETYKEKVELKKLKFENLYIQNLNLSNFDFSESIFENVSFQNCVLLRSKFDKVKMNNCSFESCNMTFSQITYSDFVHTEFNKLIYYNSYIKWLELRKCQWKLVSFKFGLLGNTDFSDCVWQDVKFLGNTELTGLTFPKDFDIDKAL